MHHEKYCPTDISTGNAYYAKKDIIETNNIITGILAKGYPYFSLNMIPESKPVQYSSRMVEQGE